MAKEDVTILGAGPYGLATAAHLWNQTGPLAGIETRTFGDPMWFWKSQMPAGMLLRSDWGASQLWDPAHQYSLEAYQAETGERFSAPVPLEGFVQYGLWFQRKAVPHLDARKITLVERDGPDFRVNLSDGDVLKTKRVIVAAGISLFARRPAEFSALPSELVSHSSENVPFSRFRGKSVAVVGGGQSALESAVLLAENGAAVELLVRGAAPKYLGWRKKIKSLGPISKLFYSWTDVGPAGMSNVVSVPSLLQMFPRDIQDYMRKRSIRPAGAGWLKPRLEHVKMTCGRFVNAAISAGEKVELTLDDGSQRRVDHVLLGTGYRIDISRYSFLSAGIVDQIKTMDGFPQLSGAFETSVPRLHILGAPAAWSYGPLMYFVSGTKFAARKLARHLATNGSKS
jgi:cation diffusion facilitator CzcD-associated flavoprotein CzcO